MGSLIYGQGSEYGVDDRTLSHMKVAITSKLRLQESFTVSWDVPAEAGSGRISLWVAPAVPLQFRFNGSRAPELNRRWLEAMSLSSHSSQGMLIMPEDDVEKFLASAVPGAHRREVPAKSRPAHGGSRV